MYEHVKVIWTDALRSGDYTQTSNILTRAYEDGTQDSCCLGVLCEEAIKAGVPLDRKVTGEVVYYDKDAHTLPMAVREWAGLPGPNPSLGDITAAEWNDVHGASFTKIADLIDEHMETEIVF